MSDVLLLETGDRLLLETGDGLLLNEAPELGFRMEVWRLPENVHVTDIETWTGSPLIDHPFSGEGAMQVVLPLDAPELELINCPSTGPTDYIRFYVDGLLIGSGIISKIKEHTLDPGEGSKHTAILIGNSVNGLLGHGLVYPALGVDQSPVEENRLFSWQSPQFDSSDWEDVAEIATGEGATRTAGIGIPMSGPPEGAPQIPGIYWIWADEDSSISPPNTATPYWAPGGTVYARKTFNVPSAAEVEIGFALDNHGQVYLDGIPIGVLPPDGGRRNFLQIHTVNLRMSSGDHTLAIVARNYSTDESTSPTYPNPAGIFCYAATLDDTLDVDTVLTQTDDTWAVLGYPATPPGMTVGQAVGLALDEEQARGRLTYLNIRNFTDAVGSNDVAWTQTGEISTRTGNDVGTFLGELQVTYCDWRVTPDCTELQLVNLGAYVQAGGPPVELTPAPPDDPESGELVVLDRTLEAGVSTFLIRHGSDPGGWSETSVAADNPVAAVLGLPHLPSKTEALKQGGEELVRLSSGLLEHQIAIVHSPGKVSWGVDYGLGDLISIEGVEYRVRTNPTSFDGKTARPLPTISLGEPSLSPQARSVLSDKRMANGTVGGRSKIASPIIGIRGSGSGDTPTPSSGCACCLELGSMDLYMGRTGSASLNISSGSTTEINDANYFDTELDGGLAAVAWDTDDQFTVAVDGFFHVTFDCTFTGIAGGAGGIRVGILDLSLPGSEYQLWSNYSVVLPSGNFNVSARGSLLRKAGEKIGPFWVNPRSLGAASITMQSATVYVYHTLIGCGETGGGV